MNKKIISKYISTVSLYLLILPIYGNPERIAHLEQSKKFDPAGPVYYFTTAATVAAYAAAKIATKSEFNTDDIIWAGCTSMISGGIAGLSVEAYHPVSRYNSTVHNLRNLDQSLLHIVHDHARDNDNTLLLKRIDRHYITAPLSRVKAFYDIKSCIITYRNAQETLNDLLKNPNNLPASQDTMQAIMQDCKNGIQRCEQTLTVIKSAQNWTEEFQRSLPPVTWMIIS